MKVRPNSICYHDRNAAIDKYGLKKYQRDPKFLSQIDVVRSTALPVLDETAEAATIDRKSKAISASLKSLQIIKSARRRSFDAFRKFFTNKFTKTKARRYHRRTSNVSVEFWEEDYVTIKRMPKN